MKKRFNLRGLLLSAMLFAGVAGFAQEETNLSNDGYDGGFRLGIGVSGSYASGDYFAWGLGGDARLQYDLNRSTSLTLTSGFTHLFPETDYDNGLSYIPAKLGFKAFVWEDSFYVMGEVGAAFAVTKDVDETSFLWSPGVGFATDNWDISARFEALPDYNTNQVALRLAYGFKL